MIYSLEIEQFALRAKPVSEPVPAGNLKDAASAEKFKVHDSGSAVPGYMKKLLEAHPTYKSPELQPDKPLGGLLVVNDKSGFLWRSAAWDMYHPDGIEVRASYALAADGAHYERHLGGSILSYRTPGTSYKDWPHYALEEHFTKGREKTHQSYPEAVVALPEPGFVETTDPYRTYVDTMTVFRHEVLPLVGAYLGTLDAWTANPSGPAPIPPWLSIAVGGYEYPMQEVNLTSGVTRAADVEPYRQQLVNLAGLK